MVQSRDVCLSGLGWKEVRHAFSGLTAAEGLMPGSCRAPRASSPECHIPLQEQAAASSQAAALSLSDNHPTFGQWQSPCSSHTWLGGAAGGMNLSSWLPDLARLFFPSMGQLSSIPWDLRWP